MNDYWDSFDCQIQCEEVYNEYSFVEQWSARQSVTLEIAGSNPVGAAMSGRTSG